MADQRSKVICVPQSDSGHVENSFEIMNFSTCHPNDQSGNKYFFFKKPKLKKIHFFYLTKKNNFYSSVFSYIFFNHTLIVALEFLLVPPIQ